MAERIWTDRDCTVTREDVLAYVGGLSAEMQGLWETADREMLSNGDTLSEEFQLAAAVVELFWLRARDKHR